MPKKRVLLVDDNATVRGAVRPLFDSHPKFEVCGEAEHGREAVEKAGGSIELIERKDPAELAKAKKGKVREARLADKAAKSKA